MEEGKRVRDRIAQAFKRAKMPRVWRELAPMSIDANSVIKNFLGKTQGDVEADGFFDSRLMEDFSYMTCKAVEYYLPSVLRVMLNQPNDGALWIYLHGFLAPRKDGELWWNLQELDRKQLEAISIWAECLGREWREYPPGYFEPDEALALSRFYRGASSRRA